MTRADQIFKAFEAFHLENPQVWELFQRFALEIVNRGLDHYGSAAVFERLRWHIAMSTGRGIKLNNNYCAYYARMFGQAFPQHAAFFRNRKLVSDGKASYAIDIQEWPGEAPEGEERINARLEKLIVQE